MADPIPGAGGTEIDMIRAEVGKPTTSATSVRTEIKENNVKAEEVRIGIFDANIYKAGTLYDLPGSASDEDSIKGKAVSAKKIVIKTLLAVSAGKAPVPDVLKDGKTPADTKIVGLANTILEKVSTKVSPKDITEYNATYLHRFIYKIVNGEVSKIEDLSAPFREISGLSIVSSSLYENLQTALLQLAKDSGIGEDQAKLLFEIKEITDDASSSRIKPISVEKLDRFNTLRNELFKSLNKDDAAVRKLTPNEQFNIRLFLFGADTVSEAAASDILVKLGLDGAEAVEYRALYKEVFPRRTGGTRPMFLVDEFLVQKFDRAHQELSFDKIKERFLKANYLKPVSTGSSKLELSDEGRREFKKLITKYYYEVLSQAHKDRSKMFQESFGQQRMYYIEGLKGIISNTCESLRTLLGDDRGTVKFLDDVSMRYQASIMSYAQLFHDLPLYVRDPSSFEKWGQVLGNLFPSELAEIFDPDDPIMEVARRETAMHFRQRIALNVNKMPSDLFSGEYKRDGVMYGEKDRDEIRSSIAQRMKVVFGRTPEEWEIDRAVNYSVGIGIATLIDPEVISSADPNTEGNFKGVYAMAPLLTAKHNFVLGRGFPGAGVMPSLLAMKVELFPEKGHFVPRRWSPSAFKKFADSQSAKYGEEVLEQFLDTPASTRDKEIDDAIPFLNREGQYQELLSMVNIATSLNSRAGWRVNPIQKDLHDYLNSSNYQLTDSEGNPVLNKEGKPIMIKLTKDDADLINEKGWGNEEWRIHFQTATQLYGSAAMWWASSDRVNSELKRYMGKQAKHNLTTTEWEEFYPGSMEQTTHALDRRFRFKGFGTSSVDLNFAELRQIRTYQVRGEAFYYFARRNPAEFIALVSQMAPEILDFETDYFEQDRERFKAGVAATKSKSDQVAAEMSRYDRLRKRWGNEFIALKKIHQWVVDNCKNKDGFRSFMQLSGDAFERCVKDKEDDYRDDHKQLKALGRRRLFLKAEDFVSYKPDGEEEDKDESIAWRSRVFEGSNSLMGILKSSLNSLDDLGGFDKEGAFKLGKQNLFYRLGEMWTLKQCDVNPFASDLNHFALYEKIGQVGEDVAKRQLGDAEMVRKAVQGVGKLEVHLQTAADTGDMTEIYKIHHAVWEALKNTISKEYADRANYILASIVAKFFYEHSNTRFPGTPFFIKPLIGAVMGESGKGLALSKLLTGNPYAKTMDINALRSYLNNLVFTQHVLPEKGIWSADQVMQALDATKSTFIFGDLAPNAFYAILLLLFFTALKKGIGELEGTKK